MASEVEDLASRSLAVASGPAAAPRKNTSGIAWLALLLVIALAGVVAWAAWLQLAGHSRDAAVEQRVLQLETLAAQRQTDLGDLGDRMRELHSDLGTVEKSAGEQTSSISRNLASVEAQLAEQQKELARFSASDRDSWLLVEAGHLLRLANQRLVMAGDPVAAQALLNSADVVLREIDDPALYPVRAAVAVDVAALRAVAKVDVEGIYLRLAALIEQAEKLVIFQLPEPAASFSQELLRMPTRSGAVSAICPTPSRGRLVSSSRTRCAT